MNAPFRRWLGDLRWLAGRGWSAEDFAGRYAAREADAWGYRGSPLHENRAELILEALPQPRFAKALEIGCAEGFLSERLAARVDRLIACDISPEAVRRARELCSRFAHAEFHAVDIRAGFPGEGFDLCLFSDVLYYLSARETDAVLAQCANSTLPGGSLVIANEWRAGARRLTPPAYAFGKLDADHKWESRSLQRVPFGEAELMLAVYRRRV